MDICFYLHRAIFSATDGIYLDTIRLRWDTIPFATGYRVYRWFDGYIKEETEFDIPSQDSAYLDTALTGYSGLKVYYQVMAYNVLSATNARSLVDSGFSQLPAPSGLSASFGTNLYSINMVWGIVDRATEYVLLASDDNSVFTAIDTVPLTSAIDSVGRIDYGAIYYYKVFARNELTKDLAEEYINYSNVDSGKISVPTTKILSASKAKYLDSIIVDWASQKNISGYALYYDTLQDSDTYKKIASFISSTDTSFTVNENNLNGLIRDKKYFFRVRSFGKNDSSNLCDFDYGYLALDTPQKPIASRDSVGFYQG